jgi:hypothetical protein
MIIMQHVRKQMRKTQAKNDDPNRVLEKIFCAIDEVPLVYLDEAIEHLNRRNIDKHEIYRWYDVVVVVVYPQTSSRRIIHWISTDK